MSRALLLAAALIALPSAAKGQEIPTVGYISSSIGIYSYQLPNSGLSPMLVVRGGLPIGTVLLLEGSVLGARPEQGGAGSTMLIPEAQVHLSLPFTGVTPYMGLGTGLAVNLRDENAGGTELSVTVSGAVGVRTWLNERLGMNAEFRARGNGADFSGTSAEYTLGLSWKVEGRPAHL